MKLSYLQQGFGAKPPVILLHPFPLHSHFWKNQLSGLSKDRHVIAPSFRGYGASVLDPSDHITVETYASDVRKTLRSAKIPKAIFAGCSMGGYVLFELFRQEPEVLAGMVLVDTRAEADTEQARGKRMDLIEKLQQTGTADIPDMAAGYLSDSTREKNPAVERDVRTWAGQASCQSVIKSLEMMAKRPDSTPTLSKINIPTMVLVGENDQVTPVDAARHIANNIDNARLEIIPEAGHLSPLENPAAVNEVMQDFLTTIS
jgi:pimeloyl-ACP methyl ester carboxylesterase